MTTDEQRLTIGQCLTQRCKELGCFGYCDYAEAQRKLINRYQQDDYNGYYGCRNLTLTPSKT